MSNKGIVFDIKRMAIHDGPGIRTTVFLKGCNLSCKWCHNPESIDFKPEIMLDINKCIGCRECEKVCEYDAQIFINGKHEIDKDKCTLCGKCIKVCPTRTLKICGEETTVQKTIEYILRDELFYNHSSGGITISGGEPLCQFEFTKKLLYAAKSKGLNTIVDTNGYCKWDLLEELMPFVDIFRIDLKHMDPKKHKKLTEKDNKIILDNIKKLSCKNKKAAIAIPIIKDINDSDSHINKVADFLSSLPKKYPVNLLPYHDYYISKCNQIGRKCKKYESPSEDKIGSIKSILENNGIKVQDGSALIN